jgi:hypothetical protein
MTEEITSVQKLTEYEVDKLIGGYKAIEEARDVLVAEHKAQIKPLEEKMQEIIGALGIKLSTSGQENFKTVYGTYYESTIKRVKVTDLIRWLEWVVEQQAWECLTSHVTKEEVVKWAAQGGEDPPGIVIEDYTSGHIRKS